MGSLNRLDKSFGPGGSFAGIILFVAGILLVPFYWTGTILLVIGAFTGFTCSACAIDPVNHRVRPGYLLFGLIMTGHWITTDPFKEVKVIRTTRSFSIFSQSNREMSASQQDYRIVMEADSPRSQVELMKCNSPDEAAEKCRKLAESLNILLHL